jgi:hypothetical protein
MGIGVLLASVVWIRARQIFVHFVPTYLALHVTVRLCLGHNIVASHKLLQKAANVGSVILHSSFQMEIKEKGHPEKAS